MLFLVGACLQTWDSLEYVTSWSNIGPIKINYLFTPSIALFKNDFRTILWQSSQKTFNREGTSGV